MNLNQFLKNGYHYLLLTLTCLALGVFVLLKIHSIEASTQAQILAFKDYVDKNPAQVSSIESLQIPSFDKDQILIQFESIINDSFDDKLEQISIKDHKEDKFVLEFRIYSKYSDILKFNDLILSNNPSNPSFPFLVEKTKFDLDFDRFKNPDLDSKDLHVLTYSLKF